MTLYMDNDTISTAILSRKVKEMGYQSIGDYVLQLEHDNAELKGKKHQLSNKQLISRLLKIFKSRFSDKQAKLLRIVSSHSTPIEGSILKEKVGITDLKSFSKEIRKKIKKLGGSEIIKIESRRIGQKTYYYSLNIIPPPQNSNS